MENHSPNFSIPIDLTGHVPKPGEIHPVQMGVPLPQGLVGDPGELVLFCGEREVACDATVLSRWKDSGLKWVLLRFLAVGEEATLPYRLQRQGARPLQRARLPYSETASQYRMETGRCAFTVSKDVLQPLQAVEVDGTSVLRGDAEPVVLRDAEGRPHQCRVERSELEHHGAVSLVLKQSGAVERAGREFCRFQCRMSFYAGTALVKMEFTLWNPKAARHPGGLWDLGDPGSVFFRSLSFPFPLRYELAGEAFLNLDPGAGNLLACTGSAYVHQGSSGHAGWRSLAHVNKDNEITVPFRGYRFSDGSADGEGQQANPAALVRWQKGSMAFALENFWETFPNRMEVSDQGVRLEPFPAADKQDFELQGGEKTTSVLWADFDGSVSEGGQPLACARQPLLPVIDPHWVCATGCIPHATSAGSGEDPVFSRLEDSWLQGPESVFALRETYEEFGWRNFGEVPADHEKQHYPGKREFISHYNNQYDLIQSFHRQFLRSGDPRWFALGSQLCRHVVNHDIYHTQQDKAAYNGGLFWHTAHYTHAGTATHRTYSRRGREAGPPAPGFGGGPSNEHDYTSGLWLHYCLTGDAEALQAMLGMASWVRDMQDGKRTVFRFLSRAPTGLATSTRTLEYQGPGRGGGYSVNTCLDAFVATGNREWLSLAENFIRICVHPEDDCDALDLLNREDRWSYVVFLQVLGKYLDLKREWGELDSAFDFVRATLLHYANWMAAKEFPTLDQPEKLEYPTSTWAAQDLRKTEVFLFAARYCARPDAERFGERAEFFYQKSKAALSHFTDAGSVRNMAILLHCLPACWEWRAEGVKNLGWEAPPKSVYPAKTVLIPQKILAKRNLKRMVSTAGLAGLWQLFQFLKRRASHGD